MSVIIQLNGAMNGVAVRRLRERYIFNFAKNWESTLDMSSGPQASNLGKFVQE